MEFYPVERQAHCRNYEGIQVSLSLHQPAVEHGENKEQALSQIGCQLELTNKIQWVLGYKTEMVMGLVCRKSTEKNQKMPMSNSRGIQDWKKGMSVVGC